MCASYSLTRDLNLPLLSNIQTAIPLWNNLNERFLKLQSSFIRITLWYGCSPVNLLHIFRISSEYAMDKQINIHILAANNLFGKLKVKHIKINYHSE